MEENQKFSKSKLTVAEYLASLSDEKLNGDFDEIFRSAPQDSDTSCASNRICQTKFMQKFASKKWLVIVYGILSLIFGSAGSYFSATITTLEKRFKISSKNLGIISTGNDISALILSAFISYYGGKKHRPRLIGFGLILIAMHCIINASPHLIYGGGQEAYDLTVEGEEISHSNNSNTTLIDDNEKLLCRPNLDPESLTCKAKEGNLMPQILLFISQMISGIGQTFCSTLGISYLDDNIQKSKVPAIMSISFFMRLLGPVLGYSLASYCLSIFIDPFATPTINNQDRRWMGAWWLGWLFFATIMMIFSLFVAMFPKELPRSYMRKKIEKEKRKRESARNGKSLEIEVEDKATFKDMLISHKRLFKNKLFMLMNISGILHLFGFLPYWIYTPKYIETIYHKSASASSFYTGTLGVVSSGFGVLISGLLISKYKPCARTLTLLHFIGGIFVTFGVFSYAFLGCDEMKISTSNFNEPDSCSRGCNCDFNPVFSPICGSDSLTYVSPCYAGCRTSTSKNDFGNCSCTTEHDPLHNSIFSIDNRHHAEGHDGTAKTGNCKIDCQNRFALFLGVMCIIKFIGSMSRTGHYLISIRSIEERDKAIAMGLGFTFIHLFALIPSPILFGWILDSTCEVFGKSCSGKQGNCWLYNEMSMKYALNFTAAFFLGLGTLFDVAVWKNSKNLNIFDEDDKSKSSGTIF